MRVWHTGKPGLVLCGVLLHSSELATAGRRCARRTHAGGWRSGLWNGLQDITTSLTGRGWKGEAHRGVVAAGVAAQSVDVEVRRRRARRSSGTGRCRGQSRGQRARGSSWSHSNAPASACGSRGAAWARASARREVAAWPSAGFGLSGRWGELGLGLLVPCGKRKRS